MDDLEYTVQEIATWEQSFISDNLLREFADGGDQVAKSVLRVRVLFAEIGRLEVENDALRETVDILSDYDTMEALYDVEGDG